MAFYKCQQPDAAGASSCLTVFVSRALITTPCHALLLDDEGKLTTSF